jgi:hypothetical protein
MRVLPYLMGLWLLTGLAAMPMAALAQSDGEATPLQLQQFTIKDRANRLEWLRCSVGQIWNGYTCIGNPRMLSLDEARQAEALASKELGGQWRLPTLDELQTLVCMKCPLPKIDPRLYPSTPAAPFWTSSKNRWSIGRYWTVNFYTGHTFGRNAPDMARYVRLVKDLSPRENAAPPP